MTRVGWQRHSKKITIPKSIKRKKYLQKFGRKTGVKSHSHHTDVIWNKFNIKK